LKIHDVANTVIALQRPCRRPGRNMLLGHKSRWWGTNLWCWGTCTSGPSGPSAGYGPA